MNVSVLRTKRSGAPHRAGRRTEAAGRQGTSRQAYWRRDRWAGYLFIGPQVLGFLVLVAVPLGAVFWFSLHDFNFVRGTFNFIGLGNYRQMLDDVQLRSVARNTALFTLGYAPSNVALGLWAALVVNKRTGPRKLLRMAFFIPVILSLPSWTVVWRLILQTDGGLNAVLSAVGIPALDWLREPNLALISVILVQVLKTFGLAMVFFLAALQGVPQELEEAAASDGATRGQIFRYVTLPTIAPAVFLVSTLSLIASFKSFSLIFLMTGGGPGSSTSVLSYYIYEQGFTLFQQGYGSALATVLFAFVLGVTALQFVIRKRWVYHEQ